MRRGGMLRGQYFAPWLFKVRYKGTSIKEEYPPYTTKLLRIKKTIHQVLSEENIIASWKACDFEIRIDDGICTHIEFKEAFAHYLRTEVDGPEAKEIVESFSHSIKT